jgi:hypothetical protein
MNNTPLYLALLHHPVYNKFGEVITTSITNLDIHDIARSALTFGVKKFFIVTPLSSQKEMLNRLIDFWNTQAAQKYNAHRTSALQLVSYQPALSDVVFYIKKQESSDPVVVGTTANDRNNQIDYSDFRNLYFPGNSPVLLLLGTGNGLAQEILTDCEHILKPVYGSDNYNHLSVRSAAAIILDRLTSEK